MTAMKDEEEEVIIFEENNDIIGETDLIDLDTSETEELISFDEGEVNTSNIIEENNEMNLDNFELNLDDSSSQDINAEEMITSKENTEVNLDSLELSLDDSSKEVESKEIVSKIETEKTLDFSDDNETSNLGLWEENTSENEIPTEEIISEKTTEELLSKEVNKETLIEAKEDSLTEEIISEDVSIELKEETNIL